MSNAGSPDGSGSGTASRSAPEAVAGIGSAPEEEAVDQPLQGGPEGVEEQDDHGRQDQERSQEGLWVERKRDWKRTGSGCREGSGPGQEKIDRAAAKQGAEIQQVIAEHPVG
jgi:hypothetical protein